MGVAKRSRVDDGGSVDYRGGVDEWSCMNNGCGIVSRGVMSRGIVGRGIMTYDALGRNCRSVVVWQETSVGGSQHGAKDEHLKHKKIWLKLIINFLIKLKLLVHCFLLW